MRRFHATALRLVTPLVAASAIVAGVVTSASATAVRASAEASNTNAYWAEYGYSAGRTAFNRAEMTLGAANVGNLLPAWAASVRASGTWSPAVTGAVYAEVDVGGVDSLGKLSVSTGKLLWSKPLRVLGPAAVKGLVLDGGLEASSPSTGATVWYDFVGAQMGPVTVDGSTAFTASDNHHVDAIDVTTGNVLWSDSYLAHGTPAVANGVVYQPANPGIVALSEATGALLWSARTVSSLPVVANGILYPTCGQALSGTNGAQVWQDTTHLFRTSAALAYSTLYCGADDGKLYALNAKTGAVRWSFTTGASFTGQTLAVANGVVYVPSADHNIYALDAGTGAELWHADVGAIANYAVVSHGALYVTANDDTLHAFRLPA